MLPPVDVSTINKYTQIQGLTGYALDLLRNIIM